ncbi:MAG: DUF4118 domain-containing protein [Planctomycetes bacterium]|nr:DUF4118 domain-containing protein [Planctomycetota bacterium]
MVYRIVATRSLASYGISMAMTATALAIAKLLRLWLQPEVPGQVSGPLFLGAVVVSTSLGGMRSGLLTTILSTLCRKLFFIPPVYSLKLGWEDVPRLAVFLLVALLISRLNARRHVAESELLATQEQMRVAQAIQQKLIPVWTPESPFFEMAGQFRPADATGGDYFDYFSMRDGCIGVVLGDVSGHGFGSALLMAETRAYLHALAMLQDDPGELISGLNRLITKDTDEERFLTLVFVRLNPHSRSFVYAGAGHEGYLFDADGRLTRLRSTGLALGIEHDTVIPCSEAIALGPGSVLVLVTDGFFETETAEGAMFGLNRLFDVVRRNRDKNARGILDSLFAAVSHDSVDVESVRDDQTAVVIKGKV